MLDGFMKVRWLVERFLGIIHVKGTTAELISDHLITFLKSSDISLEKMRGLGFDGASNMSGHRSGVQRRLKVHAPFSYLYSLSLP